MNGNESEKTLKSNLGEYKKAWLRQLQKAYANLLWQKGLKVKVPAGLGLMKNKTAWGRWIEGEGRILISEELILNHPWPAVLGILGHEIVHQLVSERPASARASQQTAHGPLFHFMGAKLGLDPFYLQASVDLKEECPHPWPDPAAEQLRDDSAKVLDKVRKLLALSGSPMEAEAQAAMKAAARLMARHNLERLEETAEGQPDDYDYRLIRLHAARIDSRLGLISYILGRHFFVKTLFTPSYDPHTDTEGHDLEVTGRPENTRLAEHVFHFLLERSESLWQEYRRTRRGGGLTARNSFILGLLRGFDQKLDEAASDGAVESSLKKTEGGFSALVLAKDKGLNDYFKKRHPRIRTHQPGRRRRFCPDSDQAGRAAGQALNLNRPLDDSRPAVNQGLHLPGTA